MSAYSERGYLVENGTRLDLGVGLPISVLVGGFMVEIEQRAAAGLWNQAASRLAHGS